MVGGCWSIRMVLWHNLVDWVPLAGLGGVSPSLHILILDADVIQFASGCS